MGREEKRGAEGDRGEGEGRGGRKPRLQDGSLAVLGCSGSGPGRGPPGRGGGRVRNQQKREGRPQVPETRQEEAWKAHKKQVKRPGSRSQAGSAGSGQPGCPGGKAELGGRAAKRRGPVLSSRATASLGQEGSPLSPNADAGQRGAMVARSVHFKEQGQGILRTKVPCGHRLRAQEQWRTAWNPSCLLLLSSQTRSCLCYFSSKRGGLEAIVFGPEHRNFSDIANIMGDNGSS